MRLKEFCTSEPNLALVIYHCCNTNPKSYVCNNESLIHDHTGAYKRIMDNVENPCTPAIEFKSNKESCMRSDKKNHFGYVRYTIK